MRFRFFYPSLLSDWNNPGASAVRGLAMELLLRGHEVVGYEPRGGGSLEAMLAAHGHGPVARFHAAYPGLASRRYDPATLDLDDALAGTHLVLVHGATDPALTARLIEHRARRGGYRLLLHTAPPALAGDCAGFDAVLSDGPAPREPGRPAAIDWPAAADTRVFQPQPARAAAPASDVVWVGDCPDDARLDELQEFLLRPVQRLGLRARVYGADFSASALQAIAAAGVQFGGWVPAFELPAIFAGCRVAVQLPPRTPAGSPDPYLLPALACGRPVVAAPWDDANRLLAPGRDYLVARDGKELTGWLARLLADRQFAAELAQHGRQTVLARHTVANRARTLLSLVRTLPAARAAVWPAAARRAVVGPVSVH